jgi:hypothetical protein
MAYSNLLIFADIHRRAVRSAIEPHLPGPARRPHRHRHRRDPVRFHPAVHHAPLLERPPVLPQLQVHLVQQHSQVHHELAQGTVYTVCPVFILLCGVLR